jgi:hypothetical protein
MTGVSGVTRTRARVATLVLAVCTALCVSACAESAQTQTCARADGVRSAVENLRNVNLSENGMVALQDGLAQVKAAIDAMRADVKADQQPQVDAVKAAVVQLQASVAAAKANPEKGSLASVGTSLALLRQSIGSLRATVGASC